MTPRRIKVIVGVSVALLAALAALVLSFKVLEVIFGEGSDQLRVDPQGQALILGALSAILLSVSGACLAVHSRKAPEEPQRDEDQHSPRE